jgi:hypothetical protein
VQIQYLIAYQFNVEKRTGHGRQRVRVELARYSEHICCVQEGRRNILPDLATFSGREASTHHDLVMVRLFGTAKSSSCRARN